MENTKKQETDELSNLYKERDKLKKELRKAELEFEINQLRQKIDNIRSGNYFNKDYLLEENPFNKPFSLEDMFKYVPKDDPFTKITCKTYSVPEDKIFSLNDFIKTVLKE